MRRQHRTSKALALCTDTWASGLATLQVLAVRVPQLLTATMSRREATKMVAEKVAAFRKGAVAAGQTALKPRRGTTLQAAFDRGVAILDAASRPARRTVQANARRLTGTRRPGSKT